MLVYRERALKTEKCLFLNLAVRMAMSRVCLRPILSERIPKTKLPSARPSMKQDPVIGTQI